MLLLTIDLPRDWVLADALRALDLAEDEVDCEYGLIALDPDAGRFALRVADAAAARLTVSGVARVFADPPIGSGTADAPPDEPGNIE
ncbi:hypothetical protein IU448_23390 [Nocardia flavorosea]|uniref:hypothetical protein n=1 Tax=Nocardia flavorosea TaxID=53429 RepID=UPI0018937E40|nr:hypothetical protein [Nocardia flavorosea]MBF6351936.1 hypothetical protein [Nocardia flavorosea]